MALANRKSENIFNKNTGGDKDAKSITTSKETEIKNSFDNGDHILDEGMFENLAPALYAVQQLSEDVEELRRFVASEITSITTSQANAITANTAKTTFPGLGTSSSTALAGDTTTISTGQASAITANTAKVSFEGGASTTLSFGEMITVPSKVKGGKDTYNIVMTATKAGLSKSITLTLS